MAKIFKVEVLRVRQMKDSGIEWIGYIPEVWNISSIGKFFIAVAGGDVKPELYSDTKDEKHPYPVYTNAVDASKVYAYTEKPFFKADTITVTGRGYIGRAIYRDCMYDAIIRLISLQPKFDLECRFYTYWIDVVIPFMHNGAAVNQLSASQILPYKIPVLPKQEQCIIADYLDEKCTEIDNAIAKTTASIEEYKKLKQAIITKAVTKGIRGNRPMKDSGIEWIGEIPADWEIVKLKYCTYIRARLGWKGLKAEEYKETGYPLLSAFNIINSKLSFDDVNYINQERYDESPEIKLKENDLLLVKDGAGIGKCAIVDELPIPSTTNGSLAVISVTEWLYSKFLYYFFLSKIFQKYIDRLKDGMGVPHLFQSDLKNIKIVFPDENEQKEIISYLDYKCSEIDEIIDNKQQLITELEAYKKSLIYEYVTGKKEVV